jgi:hypothetical protein
MIHRLPAALTGALLLAACSGSEQPSEAPSSEASVAVTETPTPIASSTGELRIPAALRGRWGLVPADCTSTRGDAKGLIVIDAETNKFYESRAKLDVVKDIRESRVSASFDFTGEGQEWKMDEELELQNDGKELVRTERGENAMPEPLRYTRCA